MEELPDLLLPGAAEWRAWLATHHADSPGVRLVLHKKGGSVTALDYAAALDEALCVGWIDGQVKRRDEGSFYQRFTPRRARSLWSARNVEHVARLTAQGRMLPAGLAAVAAAQADGRWAAAYAGSATITVPPDLAEALASSPGLRERFDALTAGERYSMLHPLVNLRTEKGRRARIARYVEQLRQP